MIVIIKIIVMGYLLAHLQRRLDALQPVTLGPTSMPDLVPTIILKTSEYTYSEQMHKHMRGS
jgi:hypothetical protein